MSYTDPSMLTPSPWGTLKWYLTSNSLASGVRQSHFQPPQSLKQHSSFLPLSVLTYIVAKLLCLTTTISSTTRTSARRLTIVIGARSQYAPCHKSHPSDLLRKTLGGGFAQ